MGAFRMGLAKLSQKSLNSSLPRRARGRHARRRHLVTERAETRIDQAPPSLDWARPTMVVVAHPDDEAIGAGALLSEMASPTVVLVTDGAPRDMRFAAKAGFQTRESYANARHFEFVEAMDVAGIAEHQTLELGFPDQDACFYLRELTLKRLELLQQTNPEYVLTQPYEGGHPDHDSTSFCVHAACRLLGLNGSKTPRVIEMTSYHLVDGQMATFEFLPFEG